MNPKISVIVPVYNSGKYIKRFIESIISQTYRQLEILLIDDGSTDGSGYICDLYEKRDSRIKVFHKENSGVADSRNYGVDNATGEFIAFIDSDDWVDKNLYMELIKSVEKYNADIAVCNFKRILNEEEKLKDSSIEEIYTGEEALWQMFGERNSQLISVVWNKLYKRYIFENMRFPKGRIHEDEFLNPKLLYKANKIVYINKELIYYRKTPNSIINSEFKENKIDYLYVLDDRSKFFLDNRLYNLYEVCRKCELNVNIEFYYKVKNSSIKNKKYELKRITNTVNNIKKELNNKLSIKDKIRINLFIFTPSIYNYVTNLKK